MTSVSQIELSGNHLGDEGDEAPAIDEGQRLANFD